MGHLSSLIIFFLSFFCWAVQGQELFPLQNFTPEDYQGETQNWDISQSAGKNMYFANNKGLLEFNGSSWKLYASPNQTIVRSVEVQGEKIYTGCYMEFGFWERDEFFELRYTSMSEKIKHQLIDDEQFWKIICYHQWVIFQSLHRLYVFDSVTDSFQIISSPTRLPKVFTVGNQIYFQKMEEGLFLLENGQSKLVSGHPVFQQNTIVSIFLQNNQLLVQTQEKGFFVLANGAVAKWEPKSSLLLNALNVYSSLQLRNGSFLIGTIGEGLYFLSPEGEITMHIDKKSGLLNNTILSLFEDENNDIWMGLDNGIAHLDYTSPFRVYADTRGIFGAVYTTATYEGFLYLGTNQGLFYRALHSTDDFKIIEGTPGQVWALKTIHGTLFCGHHSGTFVVKDNKAILVSNRLGTWDIKPLLNNENLVIQGNYEGLHVLEKKNGQWRYRNKLEGFEFSSRFFELMPDNQLFVNHEYRGVYQLEVSADFSKVIQTKKEPSAPKSMNSGMAKYHGKLLYLGDSGLYEWNQQKKQFQPACSLDELFWGDDSFLSGKFIEDGNQMLWVFSRENLLLLSYGGMDSKPLLTRFALPLSLREDKVGYENLLHLENKLYLLGTANGYILLDLDRIKDQEHFVHINAIGKSKRGGDRTGIPVLARDYRLKAQENNITFSYHVPVYDRFKKVKYQVRLEGMETQWGEWTRESDATFHNLPPGDYTFQVQAKIGDQLSANVASFRFSRAAPWYASNWVILLVVLLVLGTVLLFHQSYRVRLNRQKEKAALEKKKALTLMQLESERELIKLKNDHLNSEVEAINKELTSTTMAIVKKNELLGKLKNTLQPETGNQRVKAALKVIDENLEYNADWKSFKEAFDTTDRDFLKKLKKSHPLLTPNDLKLCVYLRLNLSSKEIAPMLNISPQSVEIKRFRLRKKMDLRHEKNLTEYILDF